LSTTLDRIAPFKNDPIRTYQDPGDVAAMQAALAAVRAEFGKTYPLVINGERITNKETIPSINPAKPSDVIGHVVSASREQADRAIEIAHDRFGTWQYTSAQERAGFLFKAAELVRQRRFHYNALLVFEVGKSWIEADADTAEAIDFLEFYAR